jgi:hypothetical protein
LAVETALNFPTRNGLPIQLSSLKAIPPIFGADILIFSQQNDARDICGKKRERETSVLLTGITKTKPRETMR